MHVPQELCAEGAVFASVSQTMLRCDRLDRNASITIEQGFAMRSPKLVIIVLVAAFIAPASITAIHAASGSESAEAVAITRAASAPDDTQIASDLTGHYYFGGVAALGAGADRYGSLESTTIRSSVRRGDVIELRVSSLLYKEARRENPLTVDSVLTYRLDGDRWALQAVRTERAETILSRESNRAGEPC